FMAVGNNRLAGGGFEVAPKARLDDGMLDLAVVSDGPAADVARLAAEVQMPENPDNRVLHYRQLSEFTIESTRDLHFNLDGEPMLERKLEFSVLPKHLGVVF
ncbi:MAG: lipid kinase YegS, partial [Deltaproteobacteria bacterium]|nr:lipid kinase YegS [Deltaproteobacteria bacterium]